MRSKGLEVVWFQGGWRLKKRLVGATYNDGLILVNCFHAVSNKRRLSNQCCLPQASR